MWMGKVESDLKNWDEFESECIFIKTTLIIIMKKWFGGWLQGLRLKFQRIFTIWLRRQFQLGSILRGTGRTRTPSSGWFLLRAESTDLLAITRRLRSSHQSGSSKYLPTPHPTMTFLLLFYQWIFSWIADYYVVFLCLSCGLCEMEWKWREVVWFIFPLPIPTQYY